MKEIMVIGAGACGLMAARILAENAHRVSVIEARDRTGGRINTIHSHAALMHIRPSIRRRLWISSKSLCRIRFTSPAKRCTKDPPSAR